MPKAKTIYLYQFSELSDAAKERARDWYRGCIDSNDFDSTTEDFVTIAEMMGVSFKTRINVIGGGVLKGGRTVVEPIIYWDLGPGGGASFEGTYSYRPDAAQKVIEHAPQDEELHRIVSLLQVTQAHNGSLICATCSTSGRNEYQVIAVSMFDANDNDRELPHPVEQIVEQCLRDLGAWLHKRLMDEQTYLYSNECVDENIEANEYTFTEVGKRED